MLRLAALTVSLSLILAACGGGGSSSAPPPPAAAPLAAQVSQAPASRAVAAGASVSFSVSAIGTAPFTYQWRRNGQAIAGATAATYTTPAVALTDDGARYSVVVTNAAGSSTSTDAVLTVFAGPSGPTNCPNGASDIFWISRDTGAAAALGQAVGATLSGCSGPVTEVKWTPVGAAPAVLSDRTQAIAIEPAAAGTYSYDVSFRDSTGTQRTQRVDLAVSGAPPATLIAIRGNGAVREGARTSLRAWPLVATGDSVASVTWAQIEGPTLELDTSDPARILFTAPAVVRDTVLRFRATVRTAGGATATDEMDVVVEKHAQAPSGDPYAFDGLHVSRVYPYKAASPYAGVLVNCVYNAQLQYTSASNNNLCTLGTLPFLHQSTAGAVPTTAQIMDRVLVSHDWMGQVFEQFLNSANASADLKRMFNGVTAIVIGAQVRPSFYYALTGAIYLDADNFWLTPEQRDFVSEVPDFRADFDRDLQYSGLWRYAFNNQNIFLAFPANIRLARSLDYLLNESGWLMYHELGHASDFLPPATRGSLNNAVSVWDNIRVRQWASDALAQQFPLGSPEMRALAQVKFITGPQPGAVINGIPYSTLTTYTPQQAAGFFSADRATDEYAYSTTREDIAMLIEEFMMQRNHGFRRDVAITDKIMPSTTSQTLIVRWGQRGRIGETTLKPRAQLVVEQLSPWVLQADANAVATLPAPIPMRAGESWAANVALPAPPVAPGQVGAFARRPSAAEDRLLLQKAAGHPHAGAGGAAAARAHHWTPNDRWLETLRR